MDNNKELNGHFKRNEAMWKIWEKNNITPETLLTVNFHFYAASKKSMENLCIKLNSLGLKYRVDTTRTFFVLKGWQIETDVTQKWTLQVLQDQTKQMALIALQTGVSLEGCGALMP